MIFIGVNIMSMNALMEIPPNKADLQSASSIWRLISDNNIILKLGEGDQGIPLFFVHAIAGDVSSYRPLVNALGPNQKIFGIQATKSILQSELGGSIEQLSRHYVHVLKSFQPEGPFVLAGWSVGAVIALEMARQLRALGRHVPLLVVLDGILANSGGGIRIWNPRYYWQLASNLPRWVADDLFEERHSLVGRIRSKLQAIVQRPKKRTKINSHKIDTFVDSTGWLPEQVSFARKLYDAGEKYVPKRYEGRVIVYAAKTQPLLHLLQVEATWGEICSCNETVHLEGTHSNFLRQPRVLVLANHLRDRLEMFRTEGESEHE
jgi:thioesterase domain-containing protein